MKVNREIVRMQLMNWCAPPGEGKAYFRPLVCRGNVENVDIFLVHAHPVTPMPPLEPGMYEPFREKYPLPDYVNRILDHEAYREMHRDLRQAMGREPVTVIQHRTTVFIEANPHPDHALAQVFLNAYPAKDLTTLKKEDRKTVQRGYDLFFELLHLFRPAWLILLGKPVFDESVKYFGARFSLPDFHKKWSDIEVAEPCLVPLATIKLHGTKCRMLGSRHFDKRPLRGVPDSEYTDERFSRFCKTTWETLTASS